MLGQIFQYLLGFIILGLFWFLLSYIAYHISVAIRRPWLINSFAVVSFLFSQLYAFLLLMWYIYTTFILFKNGEILFGIVFMLFLGGMIIRVLSGLTTLIAAIPFGFVEKYDQRFAIDSSNIIDYEDTEADDVETAKLPEKIDIYTAASRLVADKGDASSTLLQTELKISPQLALKILNKMEKDGYIGPKIGNKSRDVYIR